MEEVRKSVVRIIFEWKCRRVMDPKNSEIELVKSEFRTIVIPGVVVSKCDQFIIIIVDGTFFNKKHETIRGVKVHLPNPMGKYTGPIGHKLIQAPSMNDFLCAFKIQSNAKGVSPQVRNFIQPIKFETGMVTQGQVVHSFVFPTESVGTPAAYCPGSVIDAHMELIVHGCHVHEYAHFGSPLLNGSGNLIGICCGSQARTQTWSVAYLRDVFANSEGIKSVIGEVSYLRDGKTLHG